jgi:glycosyltransferase 2 family protein
LIETIPLSWLRTDILNPRFETVRLPLSGFRWVHSAVIPKDYAFEDIHVELMERLGGGIIIRGCPGEIAEFLMSRGFRAIRTGAQGLINLKDIRELPISVRELVKRGAKRGTVEEIPFSEPYKRRVYQFKAFSAHGSKPQLRYLFCTGFDPLTRCFVCRTPEDRWLGVVTVSTSSDSGAHTEMILRDKDAPPGIMESLFVGILEILSDEGFRIFSMGEVPFVSHTDTGMVPRSFVVRIMEKLLFGTGRILKYAYDYQSLYRFKNKFRPDWRPVYLCAMPEIPWTALADLFVESRFCALSRSELISSVKTRASSLLQHL